MPAIQALQWIILHHHRAPSKRHECHEITETPAISILNDERCYFATLFAITLDKYQLSEEE